MLHPTVSKFLVEVLQDSETIMFIFASSALSMIANYLTKYSDRRTFPYIEAAHCLKRNKERKYNFKNSGHFVPLQYLKAAYVFHSD